MKLIKRLLWLGLGIWILSFFFGGEEAIGAEFIEPEIDFDSIDPEDFE